jgi:hypothetical protein
MWFAPPGALTVSAGLISVETGVSIYILDKPAVERKQISIETITSSPL